MVTRGFFGSHLCRLAGNRLPLPSKYRSAFGGKAFIGLSPDKCLVLFPDFPGKFPGTITVQEISVCSGSLITLSRITTAKEVVVAGCGDYLEIWDSFKRWEKEKKKAQRFLFKLLKTKEDSAWMLFLRNFARNFLRLIAIGLGK
ncbi:MAG: hypothetical protein V1756_02665 [Patescibacteria group bacterium]